MITNSLRKRLVYKHPEHRILIQEKFLKVRVSWFLFALK